MKHSSQIPNSIFISKAEETKEKGEIGKNQIPTLQRWRETRETLLLNEYTFARLNSVRNQLAEASPTRDIGVFFVCAYSVFAPLEIAFVGHIVIGVPLKVDIGHHPFRWSRVLQGSDVQKQVLTLHSAKRDIHKRRAIEESFHGTTGLWHIRAELRDEPQE